MARSYLKLSNAVLLSGCLVAFAVKIAVPVAAGADELTLERQLATDVRQFGGHLISPGDLPETAGVGVLQILVPGTYSERVVREMGGTEVDRHGTAVVLARDFEQLSGTTTPTRSWSAGSRPTSAIGFRKDSQALKPAFSVEKSNFSFRNRRFMLEKSLDCAYIKKV